MEVYVTIEKEPFLSRSFAVESNVDTKALQGFGDRYLKGKKNKC